MNDTQPHDQTHREGPPPSNSQPPPTQPGFFDQVRSIGVRRSSDRWIAGVGGGLARRFGVDPLLIRAGLVALLIFGIGFLVYLIAWALIPDEKDSILAEKAIREGDGGGIFLLIVIGLSIFGVGPIFSSGSQWWSLVVTVALVAGIWWLVTRYRGTTAPPSAQPGHPSPAASAASTPYGSGAPEPVWDPATARPYGYEAPPSAPSGGPAQASSAYSTPKAPGAGLAGFLAVLGAAVLGYGIGQLIGPAGTASATVVSLVAAAAGAGLATMALGLAGRRSILGSLLSIGLALSLLTTWDVSSGTQGGGEKTWTPVATDTVSTYAWNAGSATLDLRGITERPVQRDITANMSFGELVIYVPEGITTRVIASANLGEITVQGADGTSNGSQGGTSTSTDQTFGDADEPDLTVRANVNLGALRIVAPSDPS